MLVKAVVNDCNTTSNNRMRQINYGHLEGESMKVGFDGGIKLEFHGAKLSSNGGLLVYRDLDHALIDKNCRD